ncbi:hypothetical protein MBOU_32690 [Mycobacterium bourgelatii]|uniref:Uncharacterized protein n=1 Tax=Mycobacterium bourgelatii TaxID=1273442 RepID=A0A7I9YRP3_MYCBU|nr:hypothetical protein MBOU_32690 [Mycobacterium bourgelatii]
MTPNYRHRMKVGDIPHTRRHGGDTLGGPEGTLGGPEWALGDPASAPGEATNPPG